MENGSEMVGLQSKITGDADGRILLHPHRKLMQRGALTRLTLKKKKKKRILVFLLNDMLVHTTAMFELKGTDVCAVEHHSAHGAAVRRREEA